MNEHKSFLVDLAETIDRHRPHHAPTSPSPEPTRRHRLVRWLLPNGGTLILIALLVATQSVWARGLQTPATPGPSATTVNYQGRLADSGGTPISGSRAMTFAIYDAASGGNLIWGPETHAAIPVSSGLFSVGLGSQTSGGIPTTTWNGDRYLEITVGGETLSPRELIRSVPIAGMALTVPDGSVSTEKIANNSVTKLRFVSSSTELELQEDALWHDDPALSITDNFAGGNVLITVTSPGIWCDTSNKAIDAHIWVDGVAVAWARTSFQQSGGYSERQVDLSWVLTLSPGSHTIKVQWAAESGINRAMIGFASTRSLTVLEMKR